MKRILYSLIPAALIISGILVGCSKDNPTPEPIPEPEPTVPTIVWSANPTFEEYPLSDTMDVNITVTVPEGIAGFVIDIDSPTLNAFLLGIVGLSTSMDLINDADKLGALSALGIPVGDELLGKTEIDFDLGGLFGMLTALASSGTEHNFTLTVTDAVGQTAAQTLTFIMP